MPDPSSSNFHRNAAVVAVAAWLLPGLGYLLIGQRRRGLTIGLTILGLFLAGLLIGGIRVIDVPGYNDAGRRNREGGAWRLAVNPRAEITAKPWSIAQILTGPVSVISGAASVASARWGSDGPLASVSHTPVNEAGTLYTSVAGMLNLLAIIDAAHRAARREHGEAV